MLPYFFFFYRRSYTQCCNVCYPLFLFIILAACVMACAGLIWMQIALKEDLDSLKEKLHSSKTLKQTISLYDGYKRTSRCTLSPQTYYILVKRSHIPLFLTLVLFLLQWNPARRCHRVKYQN